MTLEQQRAALAYMHVRTVTEKKDQKVYGAMALKLPALIRNAGLCQALHFVKSRVKTKAVLETLLNHLGAQVTRVDPNVTDMTSLCTKARECDVAQYVWLTRETLATVTWYGRLARSEWGILPGDDTDEDRAAEERKG